MIPFLGTDHASIATEVKIIEHLKKEGIDKKELGREGFLKRAWEWKEEYGGRIVKQLSGCTATAVSPSIVSGRVVANSRNSSVPTTGYLMCQK